MNARTAIAISTGLVLFWSATAAEYFVSPSGNNGNPGTEAQPWLTVTYGISQLSGGDTLTLRGGVYPNDTGLGGIPSGASWAAMTTIRNYTGESPVIRPNTTNDVFGFNLITGSYLCLSGLEIDLTNTMSTGAGVKITENANHVRITNCVIHHVWSGHCILITGGNADNADDNEILNCDIHNSGWQHDGGSADHGIYIKTRRNQIIGCTLHNNQDHGIHAFDGSPEQTTVKKCMFYSNPTALGFYSAGSVSNYIYNCKAWSNNIAFRTGYNSSHTYFLNNTAWKNGVNYLVDSDMMTNVVFQNCIAAQGTATIDPSGFYIESGSNLVTVSYCMSVSNNVSNFLVEAGVCVTNNNLFGNGYNPGFTDAAGLDFSLLSSSDARNTGVLQSLFSDDYIGTLRPQGSAWDMGAYEYVEPTTGALLRGALLRGMKVQ